MHSEETASGLNWLKIDLPDYWNVRDKIVHVLDYLARLDTISCMNHWEKDAAWARLPAGAVHNDPVW